MFSVANEAKVDIKTIGMWRLVQGLEVGTLRTQGLLDSLSGGTCRSMSETALKR